MNNNSLPNLPVNQQNQHVSFKVSPRRLSDGDESTDQLIKNAVNESINQQIKNNNQYA